MKTDENLKTALIAFLEVEDVIEMSDIDVRIEDGYASIGFSCPAFNDVVISFDDREDAFDDDVPECSWFLIRASDDAMEPFDAFSYRIKAFYKELLWK